MYRVRAGAEPALVLAVALAGSLSSSALGYAIACLLVALAAGALFRTEGAVRENRRRAAILALSACLAFAAASARAGGLPGFAREEQSGGYVSGQTVRMVTTAYCQPGYTAAGTWTKWGTVAGDLPLGTRVRIPDYGAGVVLDRGPLVGPGRLDVFLPDCGLARNWGTRVQEVEILP